MSTAEPAPADRAGRMGTTTGDRRRGRARARELNARGLELQEQGRYRESEPVLKKAVALAERAAGPNHPDTATPLNNLAVSYKYLARYAEAGQLYQRALGILRRAFGPKHPELATLYHNLGGLEHAAGNPARGEPFARLSVTLRRLACGSDHPDVAADMAALAAILDQQKKYEEALRLYRRVLVIFERAHGPDHDEVAVTFNNMAAIRQAQGRLINAERLYRRALAIKERSLGPIHPDVGITLNNLAVLLRKRRRFAESDALFHRARAIFERAYGANHPSVATCLQNHARLLRQTKRLEEARAQEARARRILAAIENLTGDGAAVTATLNQDCAAFRLSIRPSRIHRWGVFADEPIPAGRRVIEYTGERISRREIQQRSARPRHYLFRLNDYWCIDGAVGGSGAEYANHSCDPNLSARCRRGRILYLSRRRIEQDEELTLDYRFAPDATRVVCTCGAPACRGTLNLGRAQFERWRRSRSGGSPAAGARSRAARAGHSATA